MRERLRLAALPFPSLSVFFPQDENLLCEAAAVRVIPAQFLPRIFAAGSMAGMNGEEPPTLAYGPVDAMEKAFARGCADYAADPWTPEEMLLRCDRLRDISCIRFPGGSLRYSSFALSCGGRSLPLSAQEYKLLRTLARYINTPVSRDDLLRALGHPPRRRSGRLVDAHISSLRRKLMSCMGGFAEKRRNPLRAVRGLGYGLWNMM
ncbi:MAG: winged helix-turn-helix domain-containing protein [Spirochaetales bacterium]|nr:winged helix-turn-helix domain-containing protein [Spirochaetales bacterium]